MTVKFYETQGWNGKKFIGEKYNVSYIPHTRERVVLNKQTYYVCDERVFDYDNDIVEITMRNVNASTNL